MSTLRDRLADAGFAWTTEERTAITEIVAEWLREKAAEPHADSGAEWFGWLAEQIQDGTA